MSTRPRTDLRRRLPRAVLGLLLAATAASFGLASSTTAGQPLGTTSLSAADARRQGIAITVVRRPVGEGELLEVAAPPPRTRGETTDALPTDEIVRRHALRLLDVSAAGALAIADAIDDPSGGLGIVDEAGNQLHVALPGVAAAAFGRDGWLAAIDGQGRAWRIDPATGVGTLLSDGPYAGTVAVDVDGALVLVELSSFEAPIESRLVRIDPESGMVRPLTGTEIGLVFAVRPLPDGGLAVVTHRAGRGMELLHVAGESVSVEATLDPDAADPTISADGRTVAYAVFDDGVYLVHAGERPRRIGDGTLPRVSPDGRAVAVLRQGRTSVVDDAGSRLDDAGSPLVAWARPCDGGCGS